QAVFGQLSAYPRALWVAAGLLVLLGFMPGLPAFPFLALAGCMGAIAYLLPLRLKREVAAEEAEKKKDEVAKADAEKDSIKHSLKTPEIELLIGKQLSTKLLTQHQELAFRMNKMRKKYATQYGFVVTEVRPSDDFGIPAKSYQIKIHGT